jgi:hypothetical protein
MRNLIDSLPKCSVLCALALLACAAPLHAADKGKDTPPPESKDAPPPEAKEALPPGAGGGPAIAALKDLVGDGFLIRTTVLVPADAVTRQLGKASSDAIIVTLQKETAIAVCYYTLKAYVKAGLTDIPSCTVFP